MDDFSGLKILMVDDTPANIDVLRRILSDEGFVISVTRRGEAALTWVKNRPDLTLLDMMVPGIDGF